MCRAVGRPREQCQTCTYESRHLREDAGLRGYIWFTHPDRLSQTTIQLLRFPMMLLILYDSLRHPYSICNPPCEDIIWSLEPQERAQLAVTVRSCAFIPELTEARSRRRTACENVFGWPHLAYDPLLYSYGWAAGRPRKRRGTRLTLNSRRVARCTATPLASSCSLLEAKDRM